MAPLTSSAINKSKTLVPKAIPRRRPAPPASKPAAPAPPPSPPPAEPIVADVETQPLLPTPPPTQPETAQQPAPRSATPQVIPASVATSPSLAPQTQGTQEPSPGPASAPVVDRDVVTPADTTVDTSAGRQTAQSPSVPRVSSPAPVAGSKRKRPTTRAQDDLNQPSVDTAPVRDVAGQPAETSNTDLDTDPVRQTTETRDEAPTGSTAQTPESPSTHRRSTRTAAAKPAPVPAAQPSRAKRQKKAPASNVAEFTTEASQVESEEASEEAPQSSAPKPQPMPRATRAKKAKPVAQPNVESGESGDVPMEEHEVSTSTQRKPRQPRKPRAPRKKKSTQNADAEGGAGEDDESEDPELHEIDPNAVTMSDLTRDRKLGKQSDREAKMATIDWNEVARKRLETAEAIRAGQTPGPDNTKPVAEGNADEEGEEDNPRPRPVISGPRLRVDADGNLVVEEESLRIDRQAQATANAAGLVITEEDDLTKRVNQMSWVSDRRKDPTERLPFFKMKSDPWSDEETDRFYEALNMFGTDFFIISKMFPPKTRRQIKLKFIREERLDAARVNRALSGESTVPMSLDHFAEATGQDIDKFKDPRELEDELRQEGEEQREEIAKKKKETEEAKQQREIQMAAREKENAERAQAKKNKTMMRRGKRGIPQGTGTF